MLPFWLRASNAIRSAEETRVYYAAWRRSGVARDSARTAAGQVLSGGHLLANRAGEGMESASCRHPELTRAWLYRGPERNIREPVCRRKDGTAGGHCRRACIVAA